MGTTALHTCVLQSRRDDDWLAAHVGQMRPEPFEVLAARWRPTLHAYCLRRLRSPQEADDVVQEVLERMYRTLLRSADPRPVTPLMFTVARNACIDRIRVNTRTREAALDEEMPDLTDSIPERLEQKDQFVTTLRDMAFLSERQRRALVFREMDGLSWEAIGQRLGVDAFGARSLIFSARKVLSERRAGREIECSEFAQLTTALRRPEASHRLQAHAERCSHCQLPAAPPMRRPRRTRVLMSVASETSDASRMIRASESRDGATAGLSAAAHDETISGRVPG
ncbi:MAG TPA: RNA polymerase sigma factor [Solirubrobacteraceae bacterium]|nr:RNA polymerase sigma factor [Solirubrobacteraceae bacterium]